MCLNLEKRKLSNRDDDVVPDGKAARRNTHPAEESGDEENGDNYRGENSGIPSGGALDNATEDELEDEVFWGADVMPSIDTFEVIPSASDMLAPLVIRRQRLNAPIARKPDYSAYEYNKTDESESEGDILNADLDVSSDDGIDNKENNASVSNLRKNFTKIVVKKPESTVEKRDMFVPIQQIELDGYNFEFLLGDEKIVRCVISSMNHSLRFWLAMKFADHLDKVKEVSRSAGNKKKKNGRTISKSKMCRLLGIESCSFFKYRSSNEDKNFDRYKGYSPLEFSNLAKCSHPKVIEKLALNIDSDLVQGVLKNKV